MKDKNIKKIFLITIDTLRADHVGCIGGGKLTPNIDELAKKGVLFSKAFSNGPATTQSFSSIFASTYFLSNGGLVLKKNFKTLAKSLERNGFWTAAFHSNPFLSASLGWDRGFREYNELMEDVKTPTLSLMRNDWMSKAFRYLIQKTGVGRSRALTSFLRKTFYYTQGFQVPYAEGRVLNNHVLNWLLKNKNRRFFLWMHYMDPHEPFVPPDDYLQETDFKNRRDAYLYNVKCGLNPTMDQIEELHRLYEFEIKYVDECVGEVVSFLETHDMIDDSLIILLADHGQGFMEHGYFCHPSHSVYNEVIHVPLIIYNLNDKNNVFNNYIELLDIGPTILDRIGIKKPNNFIGKSLLSILNGKDNTTPIFSESAKPDLINLKYDTSKRVISCIYKDFKLIINDILGTKELYNIKQDFHEKNNIITTEKKIYKELTKLIQEHYLKMSK